MEQSALIQDFVRFLSNTYGELLSVVSYPDEQERTKKDIDALAEGVSVRIAIEHTSLDSMPDQRRDNAHYMEIIDGLQEALEEVCGKCHVSIVLPSYAVPAHNNKARRQEIKSSLRKWLVHNLPLIQFGHGRHEVSGLPFMLFINKQPYDHTWVSISRFDVDDKTRRLAERAQRLIREKTNKLKRYSGLGYTTILLIENDDIALMNPAIMRQAIYDALVSDLGICVDQIWFADTSIPEVIDYYSFGNGRTDISDMDGSFCSPDVEDRRRAAK